MYWVPILLLVTAAQSLAQDNPESDAAILLEKHRDVLRSHLMGSGKAGTVAKATLVHPYLSPQPGLASSRKHSRTRSSTSCCSTEKRS